GVFAVPVVVAGLVTVMVGQVIVSVYVGPVPLQPLPSVALTLIGKLPICVGVPERTPAADSVRPLGSALVVENVAPPMAPVCVKVCRTGARAVSVVAAGLVTAIVWHAIARLYVEPLPMQPLASVALTTIGNVPVCSGVPLSVPLAANVRPAGSVLAVENVVA